MPEEIKFHSITLRPFEVTGDEGWMGLVRKVDRAARDISGGSWLNQEHIAALRQLPACYPEDQRGRIAEAVEAYLSFQLGAFYHHLD